MSTMSIGFIYLFIYSFAVNHCSSNSNVIVCDATFYFFERMENKKKTTKSKADKQTKDQRDGHWTKSNKNHLTT